MNWAKCRAIEDKQYREFRESIIEVAARRTDQLVEHAPLPLPSQIVGDWEPEDVRWNQYFLGEMDSMIAARYR